MSNPKQYNAGLKAGVLYAAKEIDHQVARMRAGLPELAEADPRGAQELVRPITDNLEALAILLRATVQPAVREQ